MQVKAVMVDNIDKVMARGAKLDDLSDKTRKAGCCGISSAASRRYKGRSSPCDGCHCQHQRTDDLSMHADRFRKKTKEVSCAMRWKLYRVRPGLVVCSLPRASSFSLVVPLPCSCRSASLWPLSSSSSLPSLSSCSSSRAAAGKEGQVEKSTTAQSSLELCLV